MTESDSSKCKELVKMVNTVKGELERIPGCEPPPPPPIEPVLDEFRQGLMDMMDRLTEQVRQTNNGQPPKQTTKL